MDSSRYFDYASTTPISPTVLDAMLPYLKEDFGNASSIHSLGRQAHEAIETAREQVAQALGAESPFEIVFTSGATEGCNWVLRSAGPFAVGPFEHSAVRQTAECLGFPLLPYEGWSVSPMPGMAAALMMVNNETGAIFDLEAFGQSKDYPLFSDLTQGVGKLSINLMGAQSNIAFATLSGHKIYGPKGVGVVYARGEQFPEAVITGGSHEWGHRAGTHNVAAIVGMGKAIEESCGHIEESYEKCVNLRNIILDELQSLDQMLVNDHTCQAPHILSVSFQGIQGSALVVAADCDGFAVGAGAACSSASGSASVVLTRAGIPEDYAKGTVRISFGRLNTPESAAGLGKSLRESVKRLRNSYS